MELLKELGPKGEGNNRRSWGLFKCPSCKVSVEKPLTMGIRNKSCGASSCRRDCFTPNPHNKGHKKENKVSDIEYYSAFKEKYRHIKERYTICDEWQTLQGFIDAMHKSYVAARQLSGKVSFISDAEIVDSTNSLWKPIGIYNKFKASTDKESKFIYLAYSEGFTKIGVTNRVGDRMCSIQVCNPFPVVLLFTKEINNAFAIEKELHSKYSELNIRGEWFNLSEEQTQDIIQYLDNLEQ